MRQTWKFQVVMPGREVNSNFRSAYFDFKSVEEAVQFVCNRDAVMGVHPKFNEFDVIVVSPDGDEHRFHCTRTVTHNIKAFERG